MPDPFRLRVAKAICNTLKTITPANGYQHDFADFTDEVNRPAARVFRGRSIFGENDPLPMLSVLEDPRSREPIDGAVMSGLAKNEYRLLVQGFVTDDKENPLDPAYFASADVISALVKAKTVKDYNLLGLGSMAP